jgi:hypothetical protein
VALALILGPAHAGKISELYARYLAELSAGRAAALVVPSSEVKRQTQRELLERAPAIIGADAVDFDELFERILRLTGDRRPVLRGGARQILLRRVLPNAPESIGTRFQRLGSALLDPAAVRAAGDVALADQYERWWRALDEEQVIDRGRMRIAVIEALRTDVAAWPAGEALFAQGFDDLSLAQEELLRLIAQRAEVVLSLSYEAGRAPFQVLTPVVGRLAELAGAAGITELPAGAFDRHPDLITLERRFGEPDPDARCAASMTGGIALLEAEGERGEAELVVAEVAAALRAGVPGHRITVIAPRGGADRLRLVRQLREAGLEVDTAEQRLLVKTPFGRALLALLALAWADAPTDAEKLTWLRSPWSGAPAHLVERIERPMRRSQETLDDGIQRLGEPIMRALAPPAGARGAGTAVAEVTAAVRGMLQRAHGVRAADDSNALRDDVAVAAVVLNELQRLAAVEPAPTRDEVREQLAHLQFGGRRTRRDAIRVLDPRAARTIDVDIAIVVGLEEQALGATGTSDPLVELPEQSDVARHLAYMAVTRPRDRLVLVRRVADDEGRPLAPTAIWEDLAAAAGNPELAGRRGFSDMVFAVEDAPTVRERARSIAAIAATDGDEALRLAGAAGVTGAIRRALAGRRQGTRLADPRLLDELAERDPFGVTELDRFGKCSNVWFVERRLNPKRIDEPVDDRLRLGTIAHSVLNRFYREVPGILNATSLGPEQADRAVAEAHRIVDEEMIKVRPIVAGDRLRIDLMRWGLRRDIGRLVRRAALADAPLVPSEFEVSFGMRTAQAGRKEGIDVGVARLSGKIDRIDTDPMMTARAIVVDYKTSTIPTGPEIRDKGELQVPLYLLALREILGREPVGGLFVSIRKGATRGIVDADEGDVLPPGLVGTDIVDHETFEAVLESARAQAAERVERMRAGDVRHDPSDPEFCRKHCDYSGICRVRP